jgi:hypothetical protein
MVQKNTLTDNCLHIILVENISTKDNVHYRIFLHSGLAVFDSLSEVLTVKNLNGYSSEK